MADPLDVCRYYIGLFVTREVPYQIWTTEGWRPVRDRMITPQLVFEGLSGKGPAVGSYYPDQDSQTHVFAVDFDLDNGLDTALALGRAMWADGIPAYAEGSRRGGHLWGVISEKLPSKTVRRFLRSYIEKAKIPRVWDAENKLWADDPRVELRPAADQLHEGGFGHALRLPTMPHPKTGKRYALLHPGSGRPVEGSGLGEVLLNLQEASAQALINAAMEYVPPINPKSIDRHWSVPKPPRDHDEYDDMSAAEILRNRWGVLNAWPGKAVKCTQHDDQMPSLSILRDDRRVICRGTGCILANDGHGRGTYELMTLDPIHA